MNRMARALPGSFALVAIVVVVVTSSAACLAHADHGEEAAGDAGKSSVTIEVRDGYRHITSNGLPDHPPGAFPNRHNPNAIAPQRYAFRVPLEPKPAETPRELARGTLFGVALNGVVFDPGTAEFWRDDPSLGWRMEAIGGPRNLGLDRHHAHVQPHGAYHYALPSGLVERLGGKNAKQPVLIGWAADGFPIYAPLGYSDANDPKSKPKVLRSSYRLKSGQRPPQPDAPGGRYDGAYTRDWEYLPGSGDLDECNGRFGVTPEFPDGTYYYVVTEQFPFVPRLFRGDPDPSFTPPRRPPRDRGGEPGRGLPPRRPR